MTDAHPPATDRTAAALRIPTHAVTRDTRTHPHPGVGEGVEGRAEGEEKRQEGRRVVATSGTLTSARLSRIIARVSRDQRRPPGRIASFAFRRTKGGGGRPTLHGR